MAKIVERERARKLRRKGLGIAEIAAKMQESKSTVSYWCRDIALTGQQLKRLQQKSYHAGVAQFLKLAEQKRQKRLRDERRCSVQGVFDVGVPSRRDLFMLGLGLYWGEGYKRSNGELGFTNSDPKMISTYIRWLQEVYGIQRSELVFRISINEIHKERIGKVLAYWRIITGGTVNQFTNPSFIKTEVKKKYANHDHYFGILRVKVRGGSKVKARILGSLQAVSDATS